MSLFSRMYSGILSMTGRGGLSNPEHGLQTIGGRSRDTTNSLVVDDERAMGVSAVWACVSLITDTIASLPLNCYREVDGFKEKLDMREPLARLMCKRPNPYMNPIELRTALTLSRAMKGNAYAWIERNSVGTPVGLHPLNPEAVTVYRDGKDVLYEYHVSAKGPIRYWNRAGQLPSVFHWRGLTLDGLNGLSPLAYARHTLGITVSAERQSEKGFNSRPNGVMTSDAEFTTEQAKAIREKYNGIGSQPEAGDDGSWWLLPPKFDWKQISLNPDDLQMLESRQFSVVEISRFYRVPAVMIDAGPNSAAWPASYEGHVQSLLTFTLKPYLESFELKCAEALNPTEEPLTVEHDVDSLLRADSAGRSAYWSTMVQNGIMTRNEVRAKENLKPLDGLDEPTVQLNLTPAQDLGSVSESARPSRETEAPKSDPGRVIERNSTPVHVSMPKNDPPVVNVEAPRIEVNMDTRGRVSREVLEFDEHGFPSKVLETPLDGSGKAVVKEVTERDEHGFPKLIIERPAKEDH